VLISNTPKKSIREVPTREATIVYMYICSRLVDTTYNLFSELEKKKERKKNNNKNKGKVNIDSADKLRKS
jgi:hypothetical protein